MSCKPADSPLANTQASVTGSKGCIAVILAAGQSRRFGAKDKRLYHLPDGQTMLAAVYAQACQVFDHTVVVIAAGEQPRALGLPAGAHSILSANANNGMGHSLADAFRHLSAQPQYQAFDSAALLLADMPFIQRATLEKLKQAANRQGIIRPLYQNKSQAHLKAYYCQPQDAKQQAGHPVVFGRQFWQALHHLQGDQGAKHLLCLPTAPVSYLIVQDIGVLQDIDTPEAVTGAASDGLPQ